MRVDSESEQGGATRRGRVVFATCGGSDRFVIETAVTLASSRGAELLTLFVEDVNLLNLCDLPFAAEVDRSSATARSLSPSSVGRSMRTQTRRLNDILKELAAARSLITSMQIVRGHLMREALAATQQSDLLILGTLRRMAHRTAPQAQRRERKPVAVVHTAGAPDEAALHLAGEIARSGGRQLLLYLLGGTDEQGAGPSQDHGTIPSGHIARSGSLQEAITSACAAHARFLILSRAQAQDAGSALARFLEQPDSAIVLVP